VHVTADDLTSTLRAAGLRITAPRRAVCEIVAAHHEDHLTAATVLERARRDLDVPIDRATVYRTLEALESVGILRHAHLGHGPAVYHLAEERRHHHVVCERCGATTAIPVRDLDAFLEVIAARTGFVLDVEHFAISGLCPACAPR